MPMDIRSFFGKAEPKKNKNQNNNARGGDGGGGGGVAAASSATKRSAPPKASTSADTGSAKAGAPSKKSASRSSSTSSGKPKPLQKTTATTSKNNNKKRIVIDSSSSEESSCSDNDDEVMVVESKSPPPKKKPTATRKRKSEDVRKEISPQDFYVHDDNNNDESSKKSESKKKLAAEQPSPSKKAKTVKSSARASSTTTTTTTSSSAVKKEKESHLRKDTLVKPLHKSKAVSVDQLRPGCLNGLAFVFSGVLQNLSREDAQELIKELGGRVTTAVSGKTDYLVLGPVLEDGRPFTEGSKYKKAVEIGTIRVEGEEEFYGLLVQYDDKARADAGEPPRCDNNNAAAASPSPSPPSSSSSPSLKPPPSVTKPAVQNPYAKLKSNPYAKKAAASTASTAPPAVTSNPVQKKSGGSNSGGDNNDSHHHNHQLWVDKYKPTSTKDILGNQENARKLAAWLNLWEERFNTPQAIGKAFSGPQGPWKAALLSGPPGIGKTTTATLVAKESGRDVIEFNASDVRSKASLQQSLGDITGSRTIEFNMHNKKRTKRCIIMDEVDGMGAGDRGGIASLIQLIKHAQVPIICICNDRQAQQIKSLVPYCFDLKFRRPIKTVLAKRAVEIAAKEHLLVEINGAELLSESCGNDMRQVINALQMWASDANQCKMTYKDLKQRQHAISKDEMLRVSMFDAAKMILEGRKGLSNTDPKTERDHFFRRLDAFYVDYNFVGLVVQQNYLKVVQGDMINAIRKKDDQATVSVLERMYSAAESMSDYDLVGSKIMETQNWSLLSFSSICAVKTGFHAGGMNGGFLSGFPEFTSILGKNSTRSKNMRLLQELQYHTNYHTNGGTYEMRTAYVPLFRERFLSLLQEDNGGGVDAAIELMDQYGLDRDDVFEKLDEFSVDKKAATFEKIDSKKKAAFTRAYNERAHKSQALVAEQGGTKKAKRVASSSISETVDPDVINEDAQAEEEEEQDDDDNDDDADHAKLKSMFKSSRKGKAGSGKSSNGKAGSGGASKAPSKGAATSKGKGRAKPRKK